MSTDHNKPVAAATCEQGTSGCDGESASTPSIGDDKQLSSISTSKEQMDVKMAPESQKFSTDNHHTNKSVSPVQVLQLSKTNAIDSPSTLPSSSFPETSHSDSADNKELIPGLNANNMHDPLQQMTDKPELIQSSTKMEPLTPSPPPGLDQPAVLQLDATQRSSVMPPDQADDGSSDVTATLPDAMSACGVTAPLQNVISSPGVNVPLVDMTSSTNVTTALLDDTLSRDVSVTPLDVMSQSNVTSPSTAMTEPPSNMTLPSSDAPLTCPDVTAHSASDATHQEVHPVITSMLANSTGSPPHVIMATQSYGTTSPTSVLPNTSKSHPCALVSADRLTLDMDSPSCQTHTTIEAATSHHQEENVSPDSGVRFETYDNPQQQAPEVLSNHTQVSPVHTPGSPNHTHLSLTGCQGDHHTSQQNDQICRVTEQHDSMAGTTTSKTGCSHNTVSSQTTHAEKFGDKSMVSSPMPVNEINDKRLISTKANANMCQDQILTSSSSPANECQDKSFKSYSEQTQKNEEGIPDPAIKMHDRSVPISDVSETQQNNASLLEKVSKLLTEALQKCCHSNMTFSHFIKISGLIEINVDGKESAVINIHEKIEKADDQFWAKDVGTSTDGLFLTSDQPEVDSTLSNDKALVSPHTLLGEEMVKEYVASSGNKAKKIVPVKKLPGKRGRKRKGPVVVIKPLPKTIAPPPEVISEDDDDADNSLMNVADDDSADEDWNPEEAEETPSKQSKYTVVRRMTPRRGRKAANLNTKAKQKIKVEKVETNDQEEDVAVKPARVCKYKCDQEKCTYQTDHIGHFRNHMKRHENVKQFPCGKCKRRFSSTEELEEHQSTHIIKMDCSICKESFASRDELKEHLRIKHQLSGKLFPCDYCKKHMTSSNELERHLQEEHNHICSICGESFTGLAKLRQHRTKSHPEQALTCHICHKKLKSKGSLKKHIYRHNDSRSYTCDICGKSFTAHSTLYHHKRGVHMQEKAYKCNQCDKSFNFHHSLKLHLLQHSGQRPHKCHLCDKSYLTSAHLKGHVEAVHGGGKPRACPICNKTFPYDNSLKMHMMLHTGTRPFKCGQCQRGFISKSALKTHETSHIVGKVYKCDICNKMYKTDQLLRAHRRRHTDDGSRYMCDICGHTFMYKSNLEAHVEVHGNDRKYSCKHCDKTFKTQASLYSHALVHKSDSPFTCTVCGKAFKSKDRVAAHEKRHLGLKPFECEICHRAFPDKGGLSKHQRTVHTDFKRFVCPVCGKACSRSDNLRVHMKIHGDPSLLENIKPLPLPGTVSAEPDDKPHAVTQSSAELTGNPQLHQMENLSASSTTEFQQMSAHYTHQREAQPSSTADHQVAVLPMAPNQSHPAAVVSSIITDDAANNAQPPATTTSGALGGNPSGPHMTVMQSAHPDYMQVASSMLFMQYGFYGGQSGPQNAPPSGYNQNFN